MADSNYQPKVYRKQGGDELVVANGGTLNAESGSIVNLASGTVTLPETHVRYAQVALSNADIKALRATPKELVAAPGAGKVLEFISALLLLDYGSNALTESVDNLAVKYENGSGASVSQAIESTGFIDATADTMTTALAKIDAIAAKTGCENKALVLHNTGDGEIAGNAGNDTTMRVKVAYRVHTTGW